MKVDFHIWYSYLKYQVRFFGLFNASTQQNSGQEAWYFYYLLPEWYIYLYYKPKPSSYQWLLIDPQKLLKYGFVKNLKKYQFNKNKIRSLGYVFIAKEIKIEKK